MRNRTILVALMAIVIAFAGWNKISSEPNQYLLMLLPGGEAGSEWIGTYRGIVPCADCEGIQTELSLNKNKTFDLIIRYLGKRDGTHAYTNKFSFSKDGSTVILGGLKDEGIPNQYLVNINSLIQLDMEGNKIAGELADKYVLQKGKPAVEEKYWKMVILHGRELGPEDKSRNEPNLMLKAEGNRLTGSGGCNSFSGSYVLEGDKQITFSQIASTKMECTNMEIEPEFLRVLTIVDEYKISNDTLSLSRGSDPASVKFVAVYRK